MLFIYLRFNFSSLRRSIGDHGRGMTFFNAPMRRWGGLDKSESGIDFYPREYVPILGALEGSHLDVFRSLHEFDFVTKWAPVMSPLHCALADAASLQDFAVAIAVVNWVPYSVIGMNLRVVQRRPTLFR